MTTPHAQTITRINDRIAWRLRRGLTWADSVRPSLAENPNPEAVGVTVRKSWTTSQIIAAVVR